MALTPRVVESPALRPDGFFFFLSLPFLFVPAIPFGGGACLLLGYLRQQRTLFAWKIRGTSYCANVGQQGEDYDAITKKAVDCGASKVTWKGKVRSAHYPDC